MYASSTEYTLKRSDKLVGLGDNLMEINGRGKTVGYVAISNGEYKIKLDSSLTINELDELTAWLKVQLR